MAYEDRQGWEPGTDDFERERNEGWERERSRSYRGPESYGRQTREPEEFARWGRNRPESRRYGSYESARGGEGYRGEAYRGEAYRGESYRGEPYRAEESYRGIETFRPSESSRYRPGEGFRGGEGYRRELEGPDYYGPGEFGQRQFESGRMTGQAFGGPEYGGRGWESRSTWQEQQGYRPGSFGTGGTSRGMSRGPYTGRGPKGYHRSDERIEEDVNESLTRAGEIDATNIEIKVQNGVVTLTGTVDSRQAKREAEDLIEELSGVKEVENRLRVAGDVQTGQTKSGQQTGMTSGQQGQGQQGSREGRESESRGRSPARV